MSPARWWPKWRGADVCTSLVYKWRREARRGASGSGFAQLVVENRQELPAPAANESDGGAIVIPIPQGGRVWIATGHTEMRRGMQGLALLVQESLKRDPHICVGRGYVAASSRSR